MEAGAEEPEPSELFGDLGTLVVEGRTPGGQRGFHEGPHCVLVYPYRQNKHVCEASNVVVSQRTAAVPAAAARAMCVCGVYAVPHRWCITACRPRFLVTGVF